VNSLRLEVEAPNGDVWTQKLPSGFNVNNAAPFQDTSASNYDNLNTVHRISFATPASGVYKVRVRGINVPGTPQNYVLALTGGFEVNSDPDFALTVNPVLSSICAGETATLTTSLVSLNGLTDPVALSVSGIPAPATTSFSESPLIPAQPAATSALTIASTAGLAGGDYTFVVEGASAGIPSIIKNAGARLTVDASAPPQGELIAPSDASSGVQTVPVFSWSAIPTATKYRFELSADPTFATRVLDEEVTGTNYISAISLIPASTYYWRVTGVNACQAGPSSAVRSFTTANEICKNLNLSIPDGNSAGVSHSFTITDPTLLSDLKVSIKARHSWVGDLQFRLTRGATSIMLVDRPGHPEDQFGCGSPDVDIVLDDDASQPVDAQCNFSPPALSGVVKPEQSINAVFAGTPFAGTWTLTAIDPEGSDNGRLTQWCLIPSMDVVSDAIFEHGFEAAPQSTGNSVTR
jgi:subtilisin-like proprotein convertase family protein